MREMHGDAGTVLGHGWVEDPLTQLVQGSWGPSLDAMYCAGGWPWLEEVARLLRWRNVVPRPQLSLLAHSPAGGDGSHGGVEAMVPISDPEAEAGWALKTKSGGLPGTRDRGSFSLEGVQPCRTGDSRLVT